MSVELCPRCVELYDPEAKEARRKAMAASSQPQQQKSFNKKESQPKPSQSKLSYAPRFRPNYPVRPNSSGRLVENFRESVESNLNLDCVRQVRTRVPPANVRVGQWLKNFAMAFLPGSYDRENTKRIRFQKQQPFRNEDYHYGKVMSQNHFGQNKPETFRRPLSKSQKRRLQRYRQALKKKTLIDALRIKKEPLGSGKGCLIVKKKSMLEVAQNTDVIRHNLAEPHKASVPQPSLLCAWLE